jgi:L-seryl-tRNA(Ser) seleniumtransferase
MATYEDLGVEPFINGVGNVTTEGGSLMAPEVLEAMRLAACAYVDVPELNEKAGVYLARRIGVEAVHISCGAASGVQLSAAACLTGTDRGRVQALPHTDGWKNEFVISMVDRHTYIHQGIEVCGGKLVRVGSDDAVTAQDMSSSWGSSPCLSWRRCAAAPPGRRCR